MYNMSFKKLSSKKSKLIVFGFLFLVNNLNTVQANPSEDRIKLLLEKAKSRQTDPVSAPTVEPKPAPVQQPVPNPIPVQPAPVVIEPEEPKSTPVQQAIPKAPAAPVVEVKPKPIPQTIPAKAPAPAVEVKTTAAPSPQDGKVLSTKYKEEEETTIKSPSLPEKKPEIPRAKIINTEKNRKALIEEKKAQDKAAKKALAEKEKALKTQEKAVLKRQAEQAKALQKREKLQEVKTETKTNTTKTVEIIKTPETKTEIKTTEIKPIAEVKQEIKKEEIKATPVVTAPIIQEQKPTIAKPQPQENISETLVKEKTIVEPTISPELIIAKDPAERESEYQLIMKKSLKSLEEDTWSDVKYNMKQNIEYFANEKKIYQDEKINKYYRMSIAFFKFAEGGLELDQGEAADFEIAESHYIDSLDAIARAEALLKKEEKQNKVLEDTINTLKKYINEELKYIDEMVGM